MAKIPKVPPSPPPQMSPSPAPSSSRVGVTVPTFSRPVARVIVPRIIVNCVEGWGKTSLGAFIPSVGMVLASSETGYITLVDAGRVPLVDRVIVQDWVELIGVVDSMIETKPQFEYVVFDTLNTLEQLCHEYVCQKYYGGVWTGKGFLSYKEGYERSVVDWLSFLASLDELRSRHGVGIVILSHVQKRPFKNPLGEDFDRYEAACHAKTWNVSHRWADAVLFGTFETVVKTDSQGRSLRKGIGKSHRILYTERRDAFDAKNRYGMPEVIDMPDDPSQMWPTVWNAIIGAKK